MTKIKLDGTRILAAVGKIKPGRVAQHVRVNWKLDARGFHPFGNDVMHCAPRHRAAA